MPATDLFALAEQCLYTPAIATKLAVTDQAARLLERGQLHYAAASAPRPATDVQFPDRPLLVEPRELPRRRLNSGSAGRVALLHAVAHIEFTAIQLAWDIVYRFRGLPVPFYQDWLGVAIDEARHFRAIEQRLADFGAAYGDLPAHRGLWELAEDTADDLLARLALVPRCREARGLDVTPPMIAKLTALGDTASVAVLELILREEVGHVRLGTHWFAHVCEQRGLAVEETYFTLLAQYLRGQVRGPFNEEARRAAGFSTTELARLAALAAADRPA